jgi:hypothetical protein
MKLTQEQQKKLIERLNTLWRNNKFCNICNSNTWTISDTVFEMREFHGGNMVLGGDSAIQPVISLTCQNCGQTVFMNAIMLGVIETGHKQPNQEEGGAK